jgi:flagellar basal-body rod modification protein FlgD
MSSVENYLNENKINYAPTELYTLENTENKKVRFNGALDKNAFLNLLVTELKYQDPLTPMENREFLSQMAQFSALEQMQNLNKAFFCQQGAALIGKCAEAPVFDGIEYKSVSGKVEAVLIKNGQALLKIGENEIPVEDAVKIYETEDESL